MASSTRTAISLDPDDAQQLRLVAAGLGTNVGLLIRALIKYGLAHINDENVQAALQSEINQERERRAEVGRAAMKSRYSDKPAPQKHQPVTKKEEGESS